MAGIGIPNPDTIRSLFLTHIELSLQTKIIVMKIFILRISMRGPTVIPSPERTRYNCRLSHARAFPLLFPDLEILRLPE